VRRRADAYDREVKSALLVAVLVSAVLVAGSASRQARVKVPEVKAVGASKEQAKWLRRLGLTPDSPSASTAAARREGVSIEKAAQRPDVEVLRLKIYDAYKPATVLVLAVRRPAYFLRHQLESYLPRFPTRSGAKSTQTLLQDPFYLRVVDMRKMFVYEQTDGPYRNGGFREVGYGVRSDLVRCTSVPASGPAKVPPCPSR